MGPNIVAVGIDSLNVGFNISRWLVEEDDFMRLQDAKDSAGDRLFGGKGVTVEWGGREFNLTAKGGKGYEYQMSNEDVRLSLARDCRGGSVFPEAFVQLNSGYLWGKGYDEAYRELRTWLGEWARVVGEKVNRVDMCVDLAVDLPRLDVAREVVTRARKKVDYMEVEHYTYGRRDTGYRFGFKPIMGRLYDKGYEISKSQKAWFEDIWTTGGWDGQTKITRAEFQVRRACLKEYGVNSYSDLMQRLPDMWRYLTKDWLVLKESSDSDSNHRRWHASPLWQTVQSAGSRFGECLGVLRWKQRQARIEPLMAQMKGLMASEVAIDSKIRGQYHAVMRLKSEIKSYLDSEEFMAKVLERRGRYGSLSN